MKVAIKIYEMVDEEGTTVHDVVVNNRYVIPFVCMDVDGVIETLKEQGVTGWCTSKLGDPDLFEHKLTNLVWHGDIEVA